MKCNQLHCIVQPVCCIFEINNYCSIQTFGLCNSFRGNLEVSGLVRWLSYGVEDGTVKFWCGKFEILIPQSSSKPQQTNQSKIDLPGLDQK